MVRVRITNALVFLGVCSMCLMLAGCASGPSVSVSGDNPGIGATIRLPQKALTDVDCPLVKSGETSTGWETFDVQCEGWQRRTGVNWRGEAGSQSNWENEFLTNTDIATSIEASASCSDPESTTILNNQPAVLRRCAIYNGGFPYLFIVTRAGEQAFGSWGPMHLAPLFEAFVDVSLRGEDQASAVGSESQLIALAEQQISPNGKLIDLTSVGEFEQLEQLSTLQNSAKNHARALELAQRALEILEQMRSDEDPELLYLLGRIGLELSRLRPQEAEIIFERGARLAEQAPDSPHRPEFLVYRAWHELRNGSREQAREYAQQSLELSRAVAARYREGGISPRVAHSLISVADLLVEFGELDQALSIYEQALAIFDSVRGRSYHWVGESHRRLAELYLQRGDIAAARNEAIAAVELKRTLFGTEGRALAEAIATQAEVEQTAGQTDQALAYWQQVMDIIREKTSTETNIAIEDIAGYISLLLKLAASDPANGSRYLDQAFQASQMADTAAAGRAITQLAARLMNDDPVVRDTARELQDAQKAYQDAQYALGLEQAKPYVDRNADKLDRLNSERQQSADRVAELEQQLQNQFLGYGRLVEPHQLSVAEVAAQLRSDEALLRILPGEKESWAFLIRSDGSVRGHTIALGADDLTARVNQLRQGVEVFTSELPAFDLNLSHQFYQELLGPLDDSLNGIGNLVMVPSGALLSLPPALLLRRAPAGAGDYRNAPWLVRDMALSILPSITSLSQLRQDIKPSRAGRPFIGFGDPNFTGNAAERGGEALNQLERECQGSNDQVDPAMVRALGELPETADELYALANVLGAPRDAVHLRNQAQVSDVLAANLQDYRVIAFATHALLPGEVDCLPEPALALTPPAQPDAEEDGLLAASDVAGLQLDADWVLLSACNTGGRGGELGGESLSGLATAFFYAGARAMLVTHWAVFSEPTVTLTTGTFRRFTSAPGRGRAEALRQAQLSMVDNPETSHPVFWAAFTLVGNDVSL